MSTTLVRILRAVQLFRALDGGMPIRLVGVFVAVAEDEGGTVGELAERLRLPTASASRAIAALSDRHWIKGKPGLGLVNTTRIGCMTKVDLTPKGRALVENLEAVWDRKESPHN